MTPDFNVELAKFEDALDGGGNLTRPDILKFGRKMFAAGMREFEDRLNIRAYLDDWGDSAYYESNRQDILTQADAIEKGED